MNNNSTMIFDIFEDKPDEIRVAMLEIHSALKEKGYNSINQIVGYILSQDPTYITTHQGARNKIQKIDRDELLHSILEMYLKE